jgi:acyl carrier protein
VFPDVDDQDLPQLSQEQSAAWDSLQSVILLRVIEEQLQVQLDLFDLEGLTSFKAIEEHIRRRSTTEA